MTVLFKSVQFNCLSICHSAIICIIIIFVNYLASKIHENRTLVSKWLSKDMEVMPYLSAQHLRCIIIKNWGNPFGQFGGTHHGLWGDRRPCLQLTSLRHCHRHNYRYRTLSPSWNVTRTPEIAFSRWVGSYVAIRILSAQSCSKKINAIIAINFLIGVVLVLMATSQRIWL